MSFHLKTLKDAGLVTDRRQGRWIYYTLRPKAVEELRDVVGASGRRGAAASNRLPVLRLIFFLLTYQQFLIQGQTAGSKGEDPMSEPNITEIVRDKYAKAALRVTSGEGGCCGTASSRAAAIP